jgi:hypothetical protein
MAAPSKGFSASKTLHFQPQHYLMLIFNVNIVAVLQEFEA